MKPYFKENGIEIYCGDCRDLLPGIHPAEVSLLLSDPPYGVNERTDRKAARRSCLAEAKDFAPVHGDDAPFDPSHLLRFPRLVLFGANYYAERLPPSPSWIVWDKLAGLRTDKRHVGFNDNADVELAWSNVGGVARLIPHRWMGLIKASEHTEARVHPTQKPIELMRQIIEWLTEPGDLIVDPYMGSGSTLKAAQLCGRRAIGIEINETYCASAAQGLAQGVLFGAGQ